MTELEKKITDWIERYANTHGVLYSEFDSHVNQMAAEFKVTRDEVARVYRGLIKKWETA